MNIKDKKVCIVGVNGSGKTTMGFELVKTQLKKCVCIICNLDDLQKVPKNSIRILAVKKTPEELEEILKICVKKRKELNIDGILIDDFDTYVDKEVQPVLNDLYINHRHYGLTLIVMSRRPQNIPAKLFEIHEFNIFYAMPTSDNINRKLNAIDNRLLEKVKTLKHKDYRFVVQEIGQQPKLYKPLNVSGKSAKNTNERS